MVMTPVAGCAGAGACSEYADTARTALGSKLKTDNLMARGIGVSRAELHATVLILAS
jgi:hypothetical protein